MSYWSTVYIQGEMYSRFHAKIPGGPPASRLCYLGVSPQDPQVTYLGRFLKLYSGTYLGNHSVLSTVPVLRNLYRTPAMAGVTFARGLEITNHHATITKTLTTKSSIDTFYMIFE